MHFYQLDFVTPGNSPRSARSRKQIRHRPNLRIYARGRPQTLQRLCCCTLKRGLRCDFTIIDTFAIKNPRLVTHPQAGWEERKLRGLAGLSNESVLLVREGREVRSFPSYAKG